MSTARVITLNPGAARGGRGQEAIGVLDVGTAKMCCLIARPMPDGRFEVQGVGYQLAEGLRAGEIVDVDAAEASILAVVHEAEQQAGETLREVVVGVAGARPETRRVAVQIELGGRPVTGADLARALAHAQTEAGAEGVEVLHALPLEITLDGGRPLNDPRGMIGHHLRVVVNLVQVAAAPVKNLIATLERCHLDVAGVIAGPYAAGLACLSDDEAALGAIVVDMGGGVTGVARFGDGRLQEIFTVPLGGRHVSQDLAFGLPTGRLQAERLKTLYGSVLPRAGDRQQRLEVPGLGDPDSASAQIVTRARLTEIIRPRVEETFQLVQARLARSAIPPTARRLVLTGGASQLEGVVDLAEEMFDMPARLARSRALEGAQTVLDPAAGTTAVGLLAWAGRDDGGLTFGAEKPKAIIATRLAKFGQWLRENF